MSTISSSDVKKLARLSALTLDESEMATMERDLVQILDYVEQLQHVNTDGVEPTYQTHSLETVTRPDEIIDYSITQTELLKNAPKQIEGTIVVPRVIE